MLSVAAPTTMMRGRTGVNAYKRIQAYHDVSAMFRWEERDMMEMLTVGEAAEYLGVSRTKVWTMVKEGVLMAAQNPLDKREHLIPLHDLQQLRNRKRRPYPRTVGMVSDGTIPSDQVEDYLKANWKPDW